MCSWHLLLPFIIIDTLWNISCSPYNAYERIAAIFTMHSSDSRSPLTFTYKRNEFVDLRPVVTWIEISILFIFTWYEKCLVFLQSNEMSLSFFWQRIKKIIKWFFVIIKWKIAFRLHNRRVNGAWHFYQSSRDYETSTTNEFGFHISTVFTSQLTTVRMASHRFFACSIS